MEEILKDIIKIDNSITIEYFKTTKYPWELIKNINKIIIELGKKLNKEEFDEVFPNVWINKTAKIDPSAKIIGPCIIDEEATVKVNAYIRENVIIGKKCVIGNCSEVKNSILFDESKIPHFNYIGDSILGYKSHFGAGSLTSNVKSDESLIKMQIKGKFYDTNMVYLGSVIGDNVEIGCNAILNPGTVIGYNSTIYPLVMVRGEIESNKIVKDINNIVDKNK